MNLFELEREQCCRDTKALHCFHIKFFGHSILGRKDGHWYLYLFKKIFWLK